MLKLSIVLKEPQLKGKISELAVKTNAHDTIAERIQDN